MILVMSFLILPSVESKDSLKIINKSVQKATTSTKEEAELTNLYKVIAENQDRTITNLEIIVAILGVIVGIISFSLPIAIYFFQIRPAEKILNEVKNVDSKIEVKLIEYLKNDELKRIDNSLIDLLSPEEKTSSDAALHLSFSQTFDFSDAQLAKAYIALKSDIDINKKSILLMILSKRQSTFGDDIFKSLFKNKEEGPYFLYYSLRYFCVSGIDSYLNVMGEYILTANDPQDANTIANNYTNVAANLLSISKKAFIALINYPILNNGLDVKIKQQVSSSLAHTVKLHNAEGDLKNSVLNKNIK